MSENYIGTDPSFGSFGTQTITGTGTTSYALNQTIGETGQILVHKRLINAVSNISLETILNGNLRLEDGTASGSGTFGDNVVDEDGVSDIPVYLLPETDYTITLSGGATNITLSIALASTHVVDVVFLGSQSASPFLGFKSAQSPHLDTFNGDDSTTTFTLTQIPAADDGRQFMVFVDNVYQRYGSSRAFTTSGVTLTFNSAPPSGIENIQVYQLSQQNVLNKIDSSTQLADGVISNNSIADGTIQANKLDVTPKLASGTGKLGNTVNLFSNVGVVAGGRKNLLINGEFSVYQRPFASTQALRKPLSQIEDRFGPDRWFLRTETTNIDNAATMGNTFSPTTTSGNESSAVVNGATLVSGNTLNSCPSAIGVYNSFGIFNSIPEISSDANDFYAFCQRIPARMAKHLRYGAVGNFDSTHSDHSGGEVQPQSVTLSFWVIAYDALASSSGGSGVNAPTGTYTVNLVHDDASGITHFNGKTYTINSPGEWEYKTITFKGCDVGTGMKLFRSFTRGSSENAALHGVQRLDRALEVQFVLGTGSNYTSGTFGSDTWTTVRANRVNSSQVDLNTKSNAAIVFANVQMEIGTSATHFEQNPYATEKQMCNEFYQQSFPDGTGPFDNTYTSSLGSSHTSTGDVEIGRNYGSSNINSLTHRVKFESPTVYPPQYSSGTTVGVSGNQHNPNNAVSIWSLTGAQGNISNLGSGGDEFTSSGLAVAADRSAIFSSTERSVLAGTTNLPTVTSSNNLALAGSTSTAGSSADTISYMLPPSTVGFNGLQLTDNLPADTVYGFNWILNNEIQRPDKT